MPLAQLKSVSSKHVRTDCIIAEQRTVVRFLSVEEVKLQNYNRKTLAQPGSENTVTERNVYEWEELDLVYYQYPTHKSTSTGASFHQRRPTDNVVHRWIRIRHSAE